MSQPNDPPRDPFICSKHNRPYTLREAEHGKTVQVCEECESERFASISSISKFYPAAPAAQQPETAPPEERWTCTSKIPPPLPRQPLGCSRCGVIHAALCPYDTNAAEISPATPGAAPESGAREPELEELDIDGDELVRMRHQCHDPAHDDYASLQARVRELQRDMDRAITQLLNIEALICDKPLCGHFTAEEIRGCVSKGVGKKCERFS